MTSLMVAAAVIWGLPIASAAVIGGATIVSRSARAFVVRHLIGEQGSNSGMEQQPGAAETPFERSRAVAKRDLAKLVTSAPEPLAAVYESDARTQARRGEQLVN